MNRDCGDEGSVDEAEHWIKIYTTLVELTAEELLPVRSGRYADSADMDVLEAHLDGLSDRLAFWRLRLGREKLSRGQLLAPDSKAMS
jgi:hypothetical protein